MDGLTIGADVGTMLTGVSALTAAITWSAGRWRERQERLATTRLRNWHGFIMLNAVDTWYVRLAEDPATPTARVVLEVLSSDGGNPDATLGYNMRQVVDRDRMLSRSPTPGEMEFLKYLYREKGYGKGDVVR